MLHAMQQSSTINRRIVLASRPSGAPTEANFAMTSGPLPAPMGGEILLRTIFLSLDPYMRGRMSDAPSYAAPVGVGEVMVGGTVSRVVQSNHSDYAPGDWVVSMHGWQDYAISDGKGLTKLGSLSQPSWALGVLGMPGFTAYVGLLDIGQPVAGDTVVVAAATGAVGSIVGQIARLKNCRVVGIAGGAQKCQSAVTELGFDACVDHHSPDFAAQLKALCPAGIDVYFENVGGAVFSAVVPLLNVGARVPVCGLIAHYNDTALAPAPNRLPWLMGTLLKQRIKMQGFIISDHYATRYGDFVQQMSTWLKDGAIRYREDIVAGLERAPQAFIGMLQGHNFGKVVVRVGAD
jgi:hypothetical protein